MNKYLGIKENQNSVKKCAYKFYNKYYNLFKYNAIDFDDFVHDIYIRILSTHNEEKEITTSYFYLIIYSRIKNIISQMQNKNLELRFFNAKFVTANSTSYLYKDMIRDNFSDKQSVILISKIFYGKTFEDLAKELKCSKQTVCYHYHKALTKLKDLVVREGIL